MSQYDIIPRDYCRCSNQECDKKEVCKRAIQLKLDQESREISQPTSVVRFSEINCEKIIK